MSEAQAQLSSAEQTPSSSDRSSQLILQSDPRWLPWGLVLVTLVSITAAWLYFRSLHIDPKRLPNALSLVPGLALATFAGAALAWWGRRHGGTSVLTIGNQLTITDRAGTRTLIDLRQPHGVLLCCDKAMNRRVVAVSQHRDVFHFVDHKPSVPGDSWGFNNVTIDLGPVPLTAATANVFVMANNVSLDVLLNRLKPVGNLPMFDGRGTDGTIIAFSAKNVSVGNIPVDVASGNITSQKITAAGSNGIVQGLSIVLPDRALLVTCLDNQGSGDTTDGATPDLILPPLVFGALARVLGVDPWSAGVARKVAVQ